MAGLDGIKYRIDPGEPMDKNLNDLQNSPSNIDNKQYLDELLLKLD